MIRRQKWAKLKFSVVWIFIVGLGCLWGSQDTLANVGDFLGFGGRTMALGGGRGDGGDRRLRGLSQSSCPRE